MYTLGHRHQDAPDAFLEDDAPIGDPWESAGIEEGERRDSWLLNYIDILTLVLTLFVLLLALQPKEQTTARAEPLPAGEAAQDWTLAMPPVAERIPDIAPLPPATDQAIEESATEPHQTDAPAITYPPLLAAIPLWLHPPASPIDAPYPWVMTEPVAPAQPVEARIEPAPMAEGAVAPPEMPTEPPSPARELMDRIEAAGLTDRIQVSPLAQGARLEIHDSILFAPGRADLTPAGQAVLDELAFIFEPQAYGISVEGHTDDRPIDNSRFPSNWELSTGRASGVARYLIERGIGAERLQAVGFADTRPAGDNHTAEGRARNRRVSLVLEIPKTNPQ